ncbi:molybdenum cofactor guanylyltransferase MobA [Methylobacterium haplocladii]|uniref:Molybdenum cofactor guanylyltransferase n=1 Tax=Methylobacterium haplocladii TaxID=1176176 RepID=A0A512ILI7_9HYPH|nr:molybdenum cofactor guanylyltransferase MobA [Methylobacterium haplocladii]GEO98580.1 molybdenum cofactor guanylyltransferase [Methylobacterium haplocladii]GJD84021.1 Molybdenum cofactor guanylyltransferase [Methylobacterium haplocladii]GLS59222.1 molybdenum cofactor guanylyltransferase [Methylobacterium haplocladii]
MTPPTLGLILAGGSARRMGGGDKPLLRLGGRTLLDHVVERLTPQCMAGLALSANGDPVRFAGFPGPVLPDNVAGNPGPLAGILAGLDFAAERCPHVAHVISVAGDTPFLPRDLVSRLWTMAERSGTPIAIAASGEREHYTVALWPVALRRDVHAALVERDERRLGAFIARYGAAVATWPTEPADPFLNINAPADLATAEAVIADPERASRV